MRMWQLAVAFSFIGCIEVCAETPEIRHYVPADKNLTREWRDTLLERGEKQTFSGDDLDAIGMPVGGIGAGQLYLCGDGTLGNWEIFNQFQFFGVGAQSYVRRVPKKPVEQGFAVVVNEGRSWHGRKLCKEGFGDIVFRGEYPIGTVTYSQPEFPLGVTLEAFSPFIPLNAKDSALPATVFNITIENRTDETLQAGLLGWLENAVGVDSRDNNPESRRLSKIVSDKRMTAISHWGEPEPEPVDVPEDRPELLLSDFEAKDYGEWVAEGEAFDSGPVSNAQLQLTGQNGKSFAGSHAHGSAAVGTLSSPEFIIKRRFINFLTAGLENPEGVSVDLLVDGQVVRRASGGTRFGMEWESWSVKDLEGKRARIRIVDNMTDQYGIIGVDHVEQSDNPKEQLLLNFDKQSDFGTMVLALAGESAQQQDLMRVQTELPELCRDLEFEAPDPYPLTERHTTALLSRLLELRPGMKRTVTFVLAWHFPNAPNGHEYAARFDDAMAVARYTVGNLDRLTRDTRLWRDTYYDSTLPYWLLDRLHAPVSFLATGTAQWWQNGRFWAWEGVTCCGGTCTHVWNYAHGHARLFPELARSVREMQDFCDQDCGGGFSCNTGLVGFRSDNAYAADGQCGTVLKAYREHLTSSSDTFLRQNWPRVKKALAYLIEQDGNEDGLIENSQHNTYDINFEGPNTFVGSLYLAALRAGAEMAREVGESETAARFTRIFESGRRLTLERLWDGEYFVQDVDLEKFPKHQYGNGCLSDQLFGQGWAHQIGLGYIYPQDNVRTALESVWKYNWAPDVGEQQKKNNPGRPYAKPGQGGLFTCTWPKSKYLFEGVMYHNEIWTGIEYQVAGHMVWEGMVEQGLSICRAVHERYHPSLINPYNEVECGDHYARGLASWGVFTALAGYQYHGPAGRLVFAPKLTSDRFRTAFTTAEGWGTFEQIRDDQGQCNRIVLRWGNLRLNTLEFELRDDVDSSEVYLTKNGRKIAIEAEFRDGVGVIRLQDAIDLKAGDVLETWTRP